MTDPVHARLEEWATWSNEKHDLLGWPESIFGRIQDEGKYAAGLPGAPPVAIPDRIAAVDTAVARLEPIDKGVIRAYYLSWAPPETLWMGCIGVRSAFGFRVILKRARWKISQVIY